MLRCLALALVLAVVAVLTQNPLGCPVFCNSEGPDATYCMSNRPFKSVKNKSCYNLCVHNCQLDVWKALDSNYACAIKKTPVYGNNPLKKSGCDKLFYPAWFFTTPPPEE
ncbi:unnamed protein product [Caenorhabditis auriculariae]|uniref:Secreted protein n=1 Tax=Caenorhabditis auriculariae TaxID=2777116 RepID=A0A8S1HKZ8_9PELO|nr:unnamed protein product [Caenorhabditis auriculariae]